jgi:hypothetical protein
MRKALICAVVICAAMLSLSILGSSSPPLCPNIVGTGTGTINGATILGGYASAQLSVHVADQMNCLFRGFLVTPDGGTNNFTGALLKVNANTFDIVICSDSSSEEINAGTTTTGVLNAKKMIISELLSLHPSCATCTEVNHTSLGSLTRVSSSP